MVKTSKDEALRHAETALSAIRRAIELGAGDDVYQKQLLVCASQLARMIRELRDGPLPPAPLRAQGMAAMAADQWTPDDNLAILVIRAEQRYLAVLDES